MLVVRLGFLAAILLGSPLTPPCLAQNAGEGEFFLRTSTYAGYANVLRVGLSANGVNFTDLFSTATLTNYSRDASVAKHGSTYLIAYTDQFISTNGTFGIATSSNLVNWTQVARPKVVNVNLLTNTINNTWAPEWFVDDTNFYVVVRVSPDDQCNPERTGHFENSRARLHAVPRPGNLDKLDGISADRGIHQQQRE